MTHEIHGCRLRFASQLSRCYHIDQSSPAGRGVMSWEVVRSSVAICSKENYYEALDVWIKRPNVCSKVISCAVVEDLADMPKSEEWLDFLQKISGHCAESSFENCNLQSTAISNEFNHSRALLHRKLVPKKPAIHAQCAELVICGRTSTIFVPLRDGFLPNFENVLYKIEISGADIGVDLEQNSKLKNPFSISFSVYEISSLAKKPQKNTCSPTKHWLAEKLFPCLLKWVETANLEKNRKMKKALPASLSLIPQHEYAEMYETLKIKHGKQLIKIWQEVTDPQKYIYEDIAIATYLILLWKKERKMKNLDKKQSFIDLGCGNGLLVHILNSEGHPGKGVDLRRRKIWDLYPSTTNLDEDVVDPTSRVLYPEFDWLLGNHSDELTPWLPVLAARSGYNVRYWVLPCCFFDFFSKYKRLNSTSSQYDDYLEFVENIGKMSGFDVGVDVMRIPSTKRVCHVGMWRLHQQDEDADVLMKIDSYIQERELFNTSFEAREKIEKVRNCTKMERSTQEEIVHTIVTKLLETKNLLSVRRSTNENQDNLELSVRRLNLEGDIATKFDSAEASRSRLTVDDYQTINDATVSQHVTQSSLQSNCRCGKFNESPHKSDMRNAFIDDDTDKTPFSVDKKMDPSIRSSESVSLGGSKQVESSMKIHSTEGSCVDAGEKKCGLQETTLQNCVNPCKLTNYESNNKVDAIKLWNRGGCLPLEEAAALLGEDLKTKMKKECGGLQTLLRNHHQVFEIRNGEVRLRDWSSPDSRRPRKKNKNKNAVPIATKTRQCWFYANHPDGCPLSGKDCTFLHSP